MEPNIFGGQYFESVFNVRKEGPSCFQVIGERCSGTNYLQQLILANTGLTVTNIAGWKHGFPVFAALPDTVVLIVIVRNAASWARGMFIKPWHASPEMLDLDYDSFIRHRWNSYVDHSNNFDLPPGDDRVGKPLQYDRHPLTGVVFENIFQLRRAKLEAHRGILSRDVNSTITTHERLLRDPEGFINQFAEVFSLSKNKTFVNPSGYYGWSWPERRLAINVPSLIPSRENLLFLSEHSDEALERFFGYSYVMES